MTDAELRDAALAKFAEELAHLQRTTRGLKGFSAPPTSEWGKALAAREEGLALLTQIGRPTPPPPSGLLTLWPPGFSGGDPRDPANYPGFKVVSRFQDCVDANTDYFVRPYSFGFAANKAQGAGRSTCPIPSGRHVVMIGGESDVPSESVYDDAISLLIEAGNPAGVVHIEGVDFKRAVNGITTRTARKVQLAYCRVGKAYVLRNDHITGGVHPDVLQVWDQGAPIIALDHFHAGYTYQALSVLLAPNPKSWTMRKVSIEAQPLEPDSIKTAKGWSLAGGSVCIFGDQKATVYAFDECYCLPGSMDGGATRKLQDVFTYGQSAPPYTLTGSGGTPGDTIAWPSVALLNKGHWTFGKPPVPFVDPANVGLGYEPAGYAL